MEDDFGLLAHLDKTGTPCAYCGEPSTHTFVVGASDTLPDYRVGLCDGHQREREPRLPTRRTADKTAIQMGLDVGDV